MITSTTERAGATRPHRTALVVRSGAWAASAVAALVAVVALLGVPQDASAKYGSPLVAHVTTAGGRGGVYLSARTERAPAHRAARITATSGTYDGRSTTPHGDRRGTERLGSHCDLGNGVVLARSARPVQQIVVALSEIAPIARSSRIAASTGSRADEFPHAPGQAHRLRGPPSLRA